MSERDPKRSTPPRRTVHSPGPTSHPPPLVSSLDAPSDELAQDADGPTADDSLERGSHDEEGLDTVETTADLKVALNRPVPLSDLLKVEAKKSAIAMEATHVGPRDQTTKSDSH